MLDNKGNNQWLVIVNPNAGKGKGKKDWETIAAILKKENISCTTNFTERKGHAIAYATEGIAAGYRKIITVGGDGTLN